SRQGQDEDDQDRDDAQGEGDITAPKRGVKPAKQVKTGICRCCDLGRWIGHERLRLLLQSCLYIAARWRSPGLGTGTPSPLYCFSLLRSVRIEMPRMFAAWVRLPR